jgi:hypothetical protein
MEQATESEANARRTYYEWWLEGEEICGLRGHNNKPAFYPNYKGETWKFSINIWSGLY